MSAILTGTTSTVSLAKPCRIKSVLVTSTSGGFGKVSIFPYGQAVTAAPLIVKSVTDATMQAVFDGVYFPDGVDVVPSDDIESFAVEYGE